MNSAEINKDNTCIEQLESRIDALEKAAGRLASFEQAVLTVLEDIITQNHILERAAEKLVALERNSSATRIRDSFEHVSKIYPKTRSVLFIGRECSGDERFEYFGDNIKYAYLAFCERAKVENITCYFLTDSERLCKQITDAGLPCLPWSIPDWTSREVRILLGAKVVLLCNIFCPVNERGYLPHALLRGAKFIQMWHGIPLKEIGFGHIHAPESSTPRTVEVLSASGPFDVLVGSASAGRDEWAQRFAFHEYAPVGYPRTDVLLRDLVKDDLINVDEEVFHAVEAASHQGKPVILYVPTFRDDLSGSWFQTAKIDRLAKHCRAKGYVFCVNLHPFEHVKIVEFRQRYPDIKFVATLTDIYPILKYVNVLITDYSSLAFDFLLCGGPIIFYQPDHSSYIEQRSLIAGYEQYICGEVVSDIEELLVAVETAVTAVQQPERDQHEHKRQALRQKFFDLKDGQASQRVCELIMKYVEECD